MSILNALGALANAKCFVVFRLVPKPGGLKADKVPVDPFTGLNTDAQNPANWMTAPEALAWASSLGADCGVGIVIAQDSGLFCIDLDDCRESDGSWSPWAQSVVARFPGAYVEISVSGKALHVIGRYTGALEPHGTKLLPMKTEAYTKARFIALTATGAHGDPGSDQTEALRRFLLEYFPPRHEHDGSADWTDKPVPEWSGPEDDAALLNRALASRSAGSIFGGRVSFAELFFASQHIDKLAAVFPPQSAGKDFDHSSADQALANHLAFWTGSNCERMARLMRMSELYRDKWEREDYFAGTILHACSSQRQWYNDRQGRAEPGEVQGPPQPSDKQQQATEPPPATPVPAGVPIPTGSPVPATSGQIALPGGINIPAPPVPLKPGEKPGAGAMLTIDDQKLMFEGCTYVEDVERVLLPDGVRLNKTQFDARFSGVTFMAGADGSAPETSPWDAFVYSTVHDFPKVRGMIFRPKEPTGTIVYSEGHRYINSWVPIETPATPGDYSIFWEHMKRLLPNGRDAETLLYFMAAMVKYQGDKFPWCPFVQGVEGNGKSFLCEAIERCLGAQYTHHADASKLGGRFNGAFYGKLFIRVDEVKIDHARNAGVWETLKSYISEHRMEIEQKGVDSVTREVCFNLILLSNHKNGIRKTDNDRRIAPFFCAQQTKADLTRDGMDAAYFNRLWGWAEAGGWSIINWFLRSIDIPDEFNPATGCKRAPETTSTHEAIMEGWGAAEQEVAEALKAQHVGFKGGWVSSSSLDNLLRQMGKEAVVPRRNRRVLLATLGYQPHPALTEGRSPVRLSDGSQPVLYVHKDCPGAALKSAQDVVGAFQAAQK